MAATSAAAAGSHSRNEKKKRRRKRGRRESDESAYSGNESSGASVSNDDASEQQRHSARNDDKYRAMSGNTTSSLRSPKSLRNEWMQKIKKFRNFCGQLVNDERVQVVVIVLIIINAIMMGVGTFDFITENEEAKDKFEAIDLVFLIIFTVELALQFIYHLWHLFTDGWLLFDFIIIMMSWVFSDVQIIRSFRIFRALRLLTRIEVMKNLVSALLSVVPKMFAILLLLCLVIYIFSVMFTSLFKELYDDGFLEFDYFGTIWDSLFTCYQFMTLDDWNPIAREVMAEKSWAWFPFVAYIIISGFVVINLMIAVICDAVAALQDTEKKMLHGDDISASNQSGEDQQQIEEDERSDLLLNASRHGRSFDSEDLLGVTIEAGDKSEKKEGYQIPQSFENSPVRSIERQQSMPSTTSPARGRGLERAKSADYVPPPPPPLLHTPNMSKKESIKNIMTQIKSERLHVKARVDVLEGQIDYLMKLQKQTTLAIEEVIKDLQRRKNSSANTGVEDKTKNKES